MKEQFEKMNDLVKQEMMQLTEEEMQEEMEDGALYEARLNRQKKGGNLSYLRKGQSS